MPEFVVIDSDGHSATTQELWDINAEVPGGQRPAVLQLH